MLRAPLAWTDLFAAALAAGCVLLALRRRGGLRVLLGSALAALLAVYALNPENRVYSYHGFLHLSIVYQILEGGLPPQNPLLAGELLRYMWGPHALVAGLAGALQVAPSWVFAALNGISLVLAASFLFRTGRRLFGDSEAAALGVVLALFAFSFVQLARRLSPSLEWIELLGLPPVEKFTNLNAMPLGLVCYAAFVYALVRLADASTNERTRGATALVFVSVAGAAFLYPLLWGMMGIGGALAACLLGWREPRLRPRIVAAALAALAGSALALPYLRSVTAADSAPLLSLADGRHILVYAANHLLLALPVGGLLFYARQPLRELMRRRSAAMLTLAGLALPGVPIAILLSGAVSPGVEYKFRMLSYLPLGLLGGLALQHLRLRHGPAAFLLLTLLLLPWVNDLRYKATWRGALDPFVERGARLQHADPSQAELYAWISAQTPPDAAFVDDWLAIPVFARRALLIGLDARHGRAAQGTGYHDGWLIDPATVLLPVIGGAPEAIERRSRAARAVLAGQDLDRAASELAAIAREGGLEALYVVARQPSPAARLEAHADFQRVFANAAAAVFRVAESREGASSR